MNPRKGRLDVKKIILTVGMLIGVLIVLYMMVSALLGSPIDPSGSTEENDCTKQEYEEACEAIEDRRLARDNIQKCEWLEPDNPDEEGECILRVR